VQILVLRPTEHVINCACGLHWRRYLARVYSRVADCVLAFPKYQKVMRDLCARRSLFRIDTSHVYPRCLRFRNTGKFMREFFAVKFISCLELLSPHYWQCISIFCCNLLQDQFPDHVPANFARYRQSSFTESLERLISVRSPSLVLVHLFNCTLSPRIRTTDGKRDRMQWNLGADIPAGVGTLDVFPLRNDSRGSRTCASYRLMS